MIICGTGHRPDKLGGYGIDAHNRLVQLAVDYMILSGPQRVISGMALGWDQALAEAAIMLQIPFTAAVPFAGQECAWPMESQRYYHHLIAQADCVVQVCEPGYAPWKMQKRNEWMVDVSMRVCALWNGTQGGTANCVRYAEQCGRPIDNLWPQYQLY